MKNWVSSLLIVFGYRRITTLIYIHASLIRSSVEKQLGLIQHLIKWTSKFQLITENFHLRMGYQSFPILQQRITTPVCQGNSIWKSKKTKKKPKTALTPICKYSVNSSTQKVIIRKPTYSHKMLNNDQVK